jgi:hypothetical protein
MDMSINKKRLVNQFEPFEKPLFLVVYECSRLMLQIIFPYFGYQSNSSKFQLD